MALMAGAAAPAGGGGWLYDLLVHAGVSPETARQVNSLVIHPVEVLAVILAAVVAAHFGARAIARVLRRLAHPAADRLGSARTAGRIDTVVALVANIWRFVVAAVAMGTVLAMLGINLTPLLASATVLGATIGFGAQALVRDYLSGVALTVEDQYGIGDAITLQDTTGVVEDVSLRITRVRDPDGVVWFIPNGEIRRLGNTSRGWVRAVVDFTVAVTAPEHLDQAQELLLEAARGVTSSEAWAMACPEPPWVVGVVGLGDGTCTLRIAVRTTTAHRGDVECAVRQAGVRALMAARRWSTSGDPAG